ncbi:MAG: 4Fe-4S binding protein [Desulfurococcales archaeon]|nr:4Fe-4S binding protein [Desulfurococcales archaeon]
MQVKIHLNRELCTKCGLCVRYCPTEVFVLEGSEIRVREERCIYCRACEVLCPQGSIKTELLDDGLSIEVHKVL